MAAHPNGAGPASASKGSALTLVAMGISVLILANDFSALNVAIPEIERDLGAPLDTTQWVINGYALVFAMAIVTGGRLADMFGRKRIYLVGAVVFGVFSLLGGLAPNIGLLIAARSAMGIGGALLWPATLGITYAALPKAKAGLAGALIIGAAGIGQGLGPILGGLLTELASWRWTLLINVPIVLVAIGATLATVHEPPGDRRRRRLDAGGIATLSLALFAFLFSLDQSGDWGLTDPRIIGGFVLSVVLLVAFVRIERQHGDDALVPSDVMGNRSFRSACIAVALLAPVFFASLLYLPQFLQKVLDRSPIGAGVGMLPMMIVFAGVSFVSGKLYDRLGARFMMTAGSACFVLGPFLLSFIGETTTYAQLVPGMVVIGLGLGLFFSAVTTSAVTSVGDDRASLAGGLVYMFQIAGGAIGLGLTTAVVLEVASSTTLAEAIGRGFLLVAGIGLIGFVVAATRVGARRDRPRDHGWHLRHHG